MKRRSALSEYYAEWYRDMLGRRERAEEVISFTSEEVDQISADLSWLIGKVEDEHKPPYAESMDQQFDWVGLPYRVREAKEKREKDSMTYLHEAFDEVKA